MALPIGHMLSLEDPDFVKAWLRGFASRVKTRKLRDNKVEGENEVTDLFLATAGCESIMKGSRMAHPVNPVDI